MPALADQIELTGVVRDFRRGDRAGGHPDFQTAGAMGRFGHIKGLVGMHLGEDGNPTYNSNRPSKDTIYSAATLQQWYNDTPEVNVSAPLTITLDNDLNGEGGIYTFSSNSFFPVDGTLLGNQDLNHNFHFTFKLNTKFTYTPGQTFTFTGDDDVWVFINGTRVIDIGGVHSAVNGSVLLFDGKVFVEKADFSVGGVVKEVSTSLRNTLRDRWANLGLSGSCPVATGDRFIDLDLNNGGPDVRVEFNGSSVTASAGQDLSNVVLQFSDGSQQTFDNLNVGSSATFSGSGYNASKTVIGAWVKAGDNATGGVPGNGPYFTSGGAGYDDKSLDFFFAERHTTQSNFRIDTNMRLVPVETQTISPLYD